VPLVIFWTQAMNSQSVNLTGSYEIFFHAATGYRPFALQTLVAANDACISLHRDRRICDGRSALLKPAISCLSVSKCAGIGALNELESERWLDAQLRGGDGGSNGD
jgi:hypothetical protein